MRARELQMETHQHGTGDPEESSQYPSEDGGEEELEYDPISLKELHSWDWLGCPKRCITFLLHKNVTEVDGRDQHCAIILWLLIMLGFMTYGAFLFYVPIKDRRNPPQAFAFLIHPNELGAIQHLPYMILCPQLNYGTTGTAPVNITIISRGWTRLAVDKKNISRTPIEHFSVPIRDESKCLVKRCWYFDGPKYSADPNESMPLESRWIAFNIMVQLPDDKAANLQALTTLVYAGVEEPEKACLSEHVKPFMSSVVLTKTTPDDRDYRQERIRLKYFAHYKLHKRYRLTGRRGYYDDFIEMHSVGGDLVQRPADEEKVIPGHTAFSGAVSFRVTPFIVQYKELEPVNVLAILGAIAGIWTAFLLIFKLCFPSSSSGRRRVIRLFRPLVSKVMPRQKTRCLKSFEHTLTPVEESESLSKQDNEAGGGAVAAVGSGEFKEPHVDEKQQEEERTRRPSTSFFSRLSPGGLRRGSAGSIGREGSQHYRRLVELELPGPEERIHNLEQVMKVLVREIRSIRSGQPPQRAAQMVKGMSKL